MAALLVILLAALGYTYAGYALLLAVLWRVRPRRVVRKGPIEPRVSLVIPAYNEERAIRGKLDNVTSLTFPRERLQVVVVSDASTDRTDAIVAGYTQRGVELERLATRRGKIGAYAAVFPRLTGDIVVFSDATSMVVPDALDRLVENFADPSVGCVGAQVRFVNPSDAAVGKGVNTYWDYESAIKQRESDLDSLVSVSGTLYAVRRDLYPLDMREDLADDLIVPLDVRARGLRAVFEPAAICVEETTLDVREEVAKRTRITIQNIRGLVSRAAMFNPIRFGLFSLFLVSHKLMRLLVPALLILVFVLTAALAVSSPLFVVLAVLQLAFYVSAIAVYFLESHARVRALNAVFYFCLSNLAILLGMVSFFKGTRVATWETLRRPEP